MAGDYKIIVIGAGAAGRAAELGAKTLLLEKMERPGKKILMTGNGRCNLSNSCDSQCFMAQFGPNGRFLESAFNRFFRDDLLALLRRYGIECKTEPDGKVYPSTDNARDIVRALRLYLADGRVTVQLGVRVTGVLVDNHRVSGVCTTAGNMAASAVIVASGGSSHPQTGSTGDGFHIAAALGHTIGRLRPGLVPLVVTNIELAKQMQGSSLRNVRVTAFQCPAGEIDLSLVPGMDVGRGIAGKSPKLPIIESRKGDAIITHFGLSGPVILELSLAIIDALENGPVSVSIDLMADMDNDTRRIKLRQAIGRHTNCIYRTAINDFLPQKLVEPFIRLTGIPPDKPGNDITLEEREIVLNHLKSLRFDIKGAYSMSTAVVTAGGISLKEINPHTMASQKDEGLYFCGEIMDLDAGTGGYNLQAAFSTGYVAGESAPFFVHRSLV